MIFSIFFSFSITSEELYTPLLLKLSHNRIPCSACVLLFTGASVNANLLRSSLAAFFSPVIRRCKDLSLALEWELTILTIGLSSSSQFNGSLTFNFEDSTIHHLPIQSDRFWVLPLFMYSYSLSLKKEKKKKLARVPQGYGPLQVQN